MASKVITFNDKIERKRKPFIWLIKLLTISDRSVAICIKQLKGSFV